VARDFKVLPWVRLIPPLMYFGFSYQLRKGYGNGSNDYFGGGMGQLHSMGNGTGGGDDLFDRSSKELHYETGGGPYYGGHGY